MWLFLRMLFQFHYLLNEFSVLKNVIIPGLKFGKYTQAELESKAMEKLKLFGIEKHAQKSHINYQVVKSKGWLLRVPLSMIH